MKKIIILSLMFLTLTSLKPSNQGFPCHPNGDLYLCTHPLHPIGDLEPCTHSYFDSYGNLRYMHNGDLYPCTHALHPVGDLGPCTHICF